MKGLREHLQKAEVEYIAERGGGYPKTFKWGKDIEAHAKEIGFRIKEHIEVSGSHWILTTSGIDICLKDGFIYK